MYPPVNVNFGQLNMPPLANSSSNNFGPPVGLFLPVNLSQNPQGSNQPMTSQGLGSGSSAGSSLSSPVFQSNPNQGSLNSAPSGTSMGLNPSNSLQSSSAGSNLLQHGPSNTQSVGSQPGTSINPVCPHLQCKLNKCYLKNKLLPKPVAIKNISGLASTALVVNMDGPPEPEKRKGKMFLATVLVGQYTVGSPKLRKPPPIHSDDPCSKFYDSCVDNEINPKIFVIFDSAQAYPEYLLEYTDET